MPPPSKPPPSPPASPPDSDGKESADTDEPEGEDTDLADSQIAAVSPNTGQLTPLERTLLSFLEGKSSHTHEQQSKFIELKAKASNNHGGSSDLPSGNAAIAGGEACDSAGSDGESKAGGVESEADSELEEDEPEEDEADDGSQASSNVTSTQRSLSTPASDDEVYSEASGRGDAKQSRKRQRASTAKPAAAPPSELQARLSTAHNQVTQSLIIIQQGHTSPLLTADEAARVDATLRTVIKALDAIRWKLESAAATAAVHADEDEEAAPAPKRLRVLHPEAFAAADGEDVPMVEEEMVVSDAPSACDSAETEADTTRPRKKRVIAAVSDEEKMADGETPVGDGVDSNSAEAVATLVESPMEDATPPADCAEESVEMPGHAGASQPEVDNIDGEHANGNGCVGNGGDGGNEYDRSLALATPPTHWAAPMLKILADGALPYGTDMWYNAPRNSVRRSYQQQPGGAMILSTTPNAMARLNVPSNMRKYAAKMLHQLIDRVPEGEKGVFINKPAPGETTKYSWFVVTAVGKSALMDVARSTSANELNSVVRHGAEMSKRQAVHRELREQGLEECPTCHMFVPDPDDPHYEERVEAMNHLGQCECMHLEHCRCVRRVDPHALQSAPERADQSTFDPLHMLQGGACSGGCVYLCRAVVRPFAAPAIAAIPNRIPRSHGLAWRARRRERGRAGRQCAAADRCEDRHLGDGSNWVAPTQSRQAARPRHTVRPRTWRDCARRWPAGRRWRSRCHPLRTLQALGARTGWHVRLSASKAGAGSLCMRVLQRRRSRLARVGL